MVRRSTLLNSLAPLAVSAALMPTLALAAEPQREIAIEAQPLQSALLALAKQSGVQIAFTSQIVEGRSAPAIKGSMTVEEALTRLLSGTKIVAERSSETTIVLRVRQRFFQPASLPQAPLEPDRSTAFAEQVPSQTAPPLEEPVELSEIVVGSHLRGVGEGPSPVLTVTRQDMDRGGYATLTDALSALPQTFGGALSEDSGATGIDQTGVNAGWSSAVNLRGLGADATLVLVDGRRMAGAGMKGDFSDISLIPLVAVERVDVLLDGASALYGSDAVGGVVNIILRKDFEGAETRARLGGSTRGDLGQGSFGQSFGRHWASGHAMISVEAQTHDRLAGRGRSYAGQADLRPLGGDDRRLYYAMPGTIVDFDLATLSLVPAYAIPVNQDGTGLAPGDFKPGQNLENWRAAYDVLPRQRRVSLYSAFGQDFGGRFHLSGDLRWSERKFSAQGTAPSALMTVTGDNPYFVSPTGAGYERIAYSFLNEIGGSRNTGHVTSLAYALEGQLDLPRDWRLDVYGARAEDLAKGYSFNTLNPTLLYEALGVTPDDPATSFSAARDGYFNPFIGAGRNGRKVLDFVTSGNDRRRTLGTTTTVNAQADGTLASLPAGKLALAVGAQWRRERLDATGENFQSGATPRPGLTRRGGRDVLAAYVETRAPLFGPANRRPGFERLELSAAARFEHYEGTGSSAVPKLGIVWTPVQRLDFKASYGKSFRAPSLGELNDRFIIAPTFVPKGDTEILSLLLYGGNRDLKPEKATSWTATVAYSPERSPGLHLEATLFKTRFTDRIGQPGNDQFDVILTAEDLAPFRQFVSPTTSAADLALVSSLIDSPASVAKGLFEPGDYGAIVDARFVNTAALLVEGLDVSGRYEMRRGRDDWSLQANLSWMMHYERQVTARSPSLDLAGVAENPADLRAHASLAWTRDQRSATVTVNHVGDSHDSSGRRIASWTTFDLQGRWRLTSSSQGATELAVTVQNLFEEDPPFYNSAIALGYDPANADPQGRIVAVQLTRTW